MDVSDVILYGGLGGAGGLGGLYVAYTRPDWFLAVLAVGLIVSVLYIYRLETWLEDARQSE
jgi:hypothetical protein